MTTATMIWVTAASARPNCRLWVRFSDGIQGEVDLAEFVRNDGRPIVRALADPKVFAALRVDLDTVVWPNGFDLAPEFLHARVLTTA